MSKSTKSGAPEPMTERGKATRAKILAAAKDIIDERGRDRLAMSAVARLAGVGDGTVYLYFPTKEALAEEAVGKTSLNSVNVKLRELRKVDKLGLDDAGKWAEARKILGL